MIWKSLREEWPYSNDEVWVRYTRNGIDYIEETCSEKMLDRIECLGIPEWRELDAPEWMAEGERDRFHCTKGSWREKVGEIGDETN